MGNALNKIDINELSVAELKAIKAKVDEALLDKENASLDLESLDVVAEQSQSEIDEEERAAAAMRRRKEGKSQQPNEDYIQKKTGVGKWAARAGIGKKVTVEKKILISNESGFPLIFILSSDAHAQQLNSGNFGAGTSGVEGAIALNQKSVLNQIIQLQDKQTSEAKCRTSHTTVTVCRQKRTGHYAVYRYRREVDMGSTYTATEEMLAGDDLDIRGKDFLAEFK
jgi:hypothetical protein